MGKALELLTGIVTAPGAVQTDLTMASGNSLTVRNAGQGSGIRLLNAWVDVAVAGVFRVRSPQLHDNVQGIRCRTIAADIEPLLPAGQVQRLVPQDTLQVDLSGSGVAGVIETACMLVQYDDLPGVGGQFMTADEVEQQMINIVTVENTITALATGNYTGQEAINAEFDLLHANTKYAIMGYQVETDCGAVRWLSTDFGNLGVGGPGSAADKTMTAGWFMDLSRKSGLPLVPVFNSANASSVLIDVAQNQGAAPVTVNTILAQLG